MATAQTLEWLRLVEAAATRQRKLTLLDNATSARIAQATKEGWIEITGELKKEIGGQRSEV